MTFLRRAVPAVAVRIFATSLVAVSSLGLALHVAEAVFRARHGLGRPGAAGPALGWLVAVGIGIWIHHRSDAIGKWIRRESGGRP